MGKGFGKRMVVPLAVAGFFGFFCAYGMSGLEIPGVEITMPLLLTTFYSRLLIGFVIGLSGGMALVKGEMKNAALRGAVIGGIVSIGISFFGGWEIMVGAGILYGMIIDLVATRFGK